MMRLITGLMFVSVLSCAGHQTPAIKLSDSVHRYNNAVRWQNYKVASNFVAPLERQNYLTTRSSQTKDMKVLDFEVFDVQHTKPNSEAEVKVRFTWHQLSSLQVRKTSFKQRWKYGKNRQWVFIDQKEIEDAAPPKSDSIDNKF